MIMNVTKFMHVVIQPNSSSLKQPNIWKQPVTYQLTSIFWTTLSSIESLKSFLTFSTIVTVAMHQSPQYCSAVCF